MYDIKALYEAESVQHAVQLLQEHPQGLLLATDRCGKVREHLSELFGNIDPVRRRRSFNADRRFLMAILLGFRKQHGVRCAIEEINIDIRIQRGQLFTKLFWEDFSAIEDRGKRGLVCVTYSFPYLGLRYTEFFCQVLYHSLGSLRWG